MVTVQYHHVQFSKLGWESTERFFFSELVGNRTYDLYNISWQHRKYCEKQVLIT
jgi:hypothetical protein